MNVLLACRGIFDQIGGGQRFYANLILNNPAIDFYCFGAVEQQPRVPRNAHLIVPTDVHQRQVAEFRMDWLRKGDPAEPLRRHPVELAVLLDLAASVPPVAFDVVDVPDFLPLAVYFPECLRHFGIEFGKVALSMHGTLSMALIDNWASDLGDLSSLIEHEQLLYRYCDLRYGIGRQYLADWQDASGLPAHLLDIAKVYEVPPAQPRRAARPAPPHGPPDLCFIGRQEKWKGPDLFLELCSRLPREAFGDVLFYGPPVTLGGRSSVEELERLARHRSLEIKHEVVDAESIAQRMREDRMVVMLPSRHDTFNLVALEALLSGCPAVVSTACGACDFLDTAYPGLPYVKIDPSDLLGAYDEILKLLTDYEGARAALAEYLASASPRDYGEVLGRIYAHAVQPDPEARAVVARRFAAFAGWLEAGFLQRAERGASAGALERCTAVLAAYECATFEPKLAEAEFERAVDVVRVWQESPARSVGGSWQAVDRALDRLSGHVFGGSRVSIYRLMAEWERSRGNDLLYAAYWLRVMRLTGRIAPAVLTRIEAILERGGFPEVARVAPMLYRNDDDEIYRYLSRRSERFQTPPADELAERVEIERPAAPKISVIVSVYNGAGKVNTFVAGLERFTDEEKAITEFIFVDSASVDDTGSVLLERLRRAASRGVGALYLRSHERETIQRAWNRGIAAARGEYLAFLGVDEMDRPGSLATMAAFLDRRRDIDWVQGSAVITEVNEAGSYVRDVMAYDRNFDSQHIHYLECCYISYVGALYRKSIHERAGFYDDAFRAAGDTEFKNRALPLIRVETLPETLGTFLNYPEARTTQSPAAELEDICAWHLHRTPGGVRYALETCGPVECVRQFRRALHYKKSYMDGICTDVDYAWSVAQYLKRHRPDAFVTIEDFVPNLLGLRLAYDRLDEPVDPQLCPGAKGYEAIGAALEHAWFGIAQAYSVHKMLGMPADYRPAGDNRWHQHHLLWPSTTRRPPAESQAAEARDSAQEEARAVPDAVAPGGVFEVDLSRPVGGSGWYEAEAAGGSWFRWTGPEPRFVVEVMLVPQLSYRCQMVMAPVRPHVSDDLAVSVNEVAVVQEEAWQPDGSLHLAFAIPATLTQSSPDFCRIVFRHRAVYSPREEGGDDARRLGFAVRSIAFLPEPGEGQPEAEARLPDAGVAEIDRQPALAAAPAMARPARKSRAASRAKRRAARRPADAAGGEGLPQG